MSTPPTGAAGTFSFADGLRLVRLRGEAMQDASDARPSGMTSLMGATVEQAEALAAAGRRARHLPGGQPQFPGPGRRLGGDPGAGGRGSGRQGARCAARAAAGRGRRLPLRVHAARRGAPRRRPWRTPRSARPPGAGPVERDRRSGHGRSRRSAETLGTQVCAPVLWERSMRCRPRGGSDRLFAEPAPGEVLAGILRQDRRGRRSQRSLRRRGIRPPSASDPRERPAWRPGIAAQLD